MKKILLILIIPKLLIAKDNFNEVYTADIPPKAVDIIYKENGEFLQVTSDRWIDRVKTDKGLKYHTFEQGYNYERKLGFIKVYDDSNQLIQESWDKNIDGGVAKEELLKAFELFKQNEVVIKQLKQADSNITIHGGFNYQDQNKCQLGSRCVHVFASTNTIPILAHSIVRLVDNSIAYADFEANPQINKKQK